MANRYWVGGNGNWSNTNYWSSTSSGTGGDSIPVSGDIAIFDNSSGGGTANVDTNSITGMVTIGTGYASSSSGTAQISTAQKITGNSSLLLDGDSDFIRFPDSIDWTFGSGDFTIDGWFRTVSGGGSQEIFIQLNTANNDFLDVFKDQNYLYFRAYDNGQYQASYKGEFTNSINNWYHFEIARSSNTCLMFLNGTTVSVTTIATFNTLADLPAVLTIGRNDYIPGSSYFNGYLDELRISKGIVRHTDNFATSTNLVIPDTYTKLLLHFEGANGSTGYVDSSRETGTTLKLSANLTITSDLTLCSTQSFIGNADYALIVSGNSRITGIAGATTFNNFQIISGSSAILNAKESFSIGTFNAIGTVLNKIDLYTTSYGSTSSLIVNKLGTVKNVRATDINSAAGTTVIDIGGTLSNTTNWQTWATGDTYFIASSTANDAMDLYVDGDLIARWSAL